MNNEIKNFLKVEVQSSTRIAVVDDNKCQPQKCNQECKKNCPVVRMGKLCIQVEKTSKIAFFSESLCIGCGICTKVCPFNAVKIINLPHALADKDATHRYGANTFKLFRLPVPRRGSVLGLVGSNGTGKSTALKILSGKLKPNLGNFENPPSWEQIIKNFRGSELQNYFKTMVEGKLSCCLKPQHVYMLIKVASGLVGTLLEARDERGIKDEAIQALELEGLLDKDISILSGGELQRVSIALTFMRKADVYMFDEPSSFLDIAQRMKVARFIRTLAEDLEKYVIVVEHDLSVLEFMSDYVCVLYGAPGAYGIITHPSGVREGINIFLDGYHPSENTRFRDTSLSFKTSIDTGTSISSVEYEKEASNENVTEPQTQVPIKVKKKAGKIIKEEKEVVNESTQIAPAPRVKKPDYRHSYPAMVKTQGNFKLDVEAGNFGESEILVLLGQNGTGKTTFIKLLAGKLESDNGSKMENLSVSYKPQEISFNSAIGALTVRQLLQKKIAASLYDPVFTSDILKPLQIETVMDQAISTLSGGEIQRMAIILCLGTPADVYLLDEPSAMLDAEQRLIAAKAIKRFIMHTKKTAFVVEHDFIMATYLADRVIVYDGIPSKACQASAPQEFGSGFNRFLAKLGVTFRRDVNNYRPRINKPNSKSDREQKKTGKFFYCDEDSQLRL